MEHVWISESQCKYFLFPILRMKLEVWWLFLPVPPNSVSAPTPRPTCHVFKNNCMEKRNRADCIQITWGKESISIFSYFPFHLEAGLEHSFKDFHHELVYFPNLFVLVWIWRKNSDFSRYWLRLNLPPVVKKEKFSPSGYISHKPHTCRAMLSFKFIFALFIYSFIFTGIL